MAFGAPPRRARLAELSLTPLIDVVLNLLVFFMLSANFAEQAMLDVHLPPSDEKPSPPSADDVVVFVTRDGRIVHEDVEVDRHQLTARLAVARERRPRATVVVRADADSAHRYLVEVIAAAKEAGFVDVGIAVESDERRSE